jgi:hypothetical protein
MRLGNLRPPPVEEAASAILQAAMAQLRGLLKTPDF